MDLPDPRPMSDNVDISTVWYEQANVQNTNVSPAPTAVSQGISMGGNGRFIETDVPNNMGVM